MNTKVKGLLKGLRYISQIFEPNGKEEEMQIGPPTDVKHVAHIGWDGPSVNPPSWMKEYRSAPLTGPGTETMGDYDPVASTTFPSQEFGGNGTSELKVPKPSRRNRSVPDSPTGSPARALPLPRPTRRHAHAGSIDSAFPEMSQSGKPRRHIRSNESSPADSPNRQPRRPSRVKELKNGAESPPVAPKQSRRKKIGLKAAKDVVGLTVTDKQVEDPKKEAALVESEPLPLPTIPLKETSIL